MIASNGRTFVFNNQPMDQASGETFCNMMGGHLVSYNSSSEQREVRQLGPRPMMSAAGSPWKGSNLRQQHVALLCQRQGSPATRVPSRSLPQVEAYFVQKGLLLPLFHKTYWIGYSSDNAKWPLFKPADATVLPLTSPRAYNHFGLMRFTNTSIPALAEPNNLSGAEYCAVANFSQTYVGAWGWSDIGCGGQHTVMCMVQSGWRAGSASAAPLLALRPAHLPARHAPAGHGEALLMQPPLAGPAR